MALIQTIRGIYPVRGLFQERSIRKWLSSSYDISARRRKLQEDTSRKKRKVHYAFLELLSLVVMTDSRAIFDLPAEQLLAQIGAAADLVTTYPAKYRSLLLAPVGKPGARDAGLYLKKWLSRQENMRRSEDQRFSEPDVSVDQGYIEIRDRVAQHI